MVKYNKIDDGAKEAIVRVLKKKRGGSNTKVLQTDSKESGSKELQVEDKEEEFKKEIEEESEITKEKKERLVSLLLEIDDEAEDFKGSVDDYINDRLKILNKPQLDEEGYEEKEGGGSHTIKEDVIEQYAQKHGLGYDEAIDEIISDIENKKILFKKKYKKKLPIQLMLKTYEFNELKTLSKEGAKQREKMSSIILGNRPSDYFRNELGYCNEYMFEKYVLNNPDTEMNILRFVSTDSFYDTADFLDNGKFIELKSVIQIDDKTNQPYDNPIFWCPKDKVEKILEKTSSFKIFWSVVKPNGTFKESCERYNNMVYDSVKNNNPKEYLDTLYYIEVDSSIIKKVPHKNRKSVINGQTTWQETYLFDQAKLKDKGVRHYSTNSIWEPVDKYGFID